MLSKTMLLVDVYESNVKQFVVCTLELYLSLLLMVSLFQSPDATKRDVQELHTTFYMAWVPLICTVTLLYSAKVLGKYGPEPDNFDRNLMGLKITMWIYAFVELVLDKSMAIKRGPALYVAIIFCACDMIRFHMEATRLIYDDEELEEEIDRLANMVIEALENDDDETAFKHAVREVIHRNREQSALETMAENQDAEDLPTNSLYEKHTSSKEILSQVDEIAESTTDYGTLAIQV
ncbi:hypothetical protein KRP22_005768 [Phytophthora ramorum]|uniref:uncharacterized protein n=1 Tax=Phytophthora ramorum TaxID=164328 RepID=UPI0030A7D16B|nr:hypothetical protein KRP23_3665 [Phytophthora ramorum]KAH7508007.1 hypothetical protein KRP22_3100 [Phytophthora ramorum]